MKKILCILAVLMLTSALSAAASADVPTTCYVCGADAIFDTNPCATDYIAPTCTTDGRECYICNNLDGHTGEYNNSPVHNYVTIEKNPSKHHFVKGNTIAPTCTTEGYTEYNCACGESEAREKTSPTGHHLVPTGKVIAEPTYTKKGITEYKCTNPNCAYSENRAEIPMLIPVADIALSKSSVELKVGDTCTVSASAGPANATNKSVRWTSSRDSVVTVSNGKITAKGVGIAYLQAIAADEQGAYSDWLTVTVYQADEPTPSPTPTPTPTPVPTNPPSPFSTVYAYTNPAGLAVILGSGSYPTGSNVTLTVANILPGYVFTGWSLSNGTTSPDQTLSFPLNENITAIANIARSTATYSVTYMPNDAKETNVYTQEKYAGIPVTIRSSIYTKDGYVQSGWKTPDGRVFSFGSKYITDSNLVLYPVWSIPGQHTLKVTFNADGKGKVHTGQTTVENGMTFKVKDNESATFHFDTVDDIYPYNIRLNGVSKGSYSTYTVRGQAYDQELYIEFASIYDHPKTGDSHELLIYSVLSIASLGALAAALKIRRKKNG